MRHGGRVLADQLALQGTERVFTVPGESFLALLDGLLDVSIENIVCRHEGGAAMMAEAHGKLTGRPGVAIVTRGPGATNASSGVHVARHDSTPMLLLVGQVPRRQRHLDAFQEIEIAQMFRPICKWAAEIETPEKIPETIEYAFRTAMSGRPGPVVLSLPEDMLHEMADVADGEPVGRPHYAVTPEDAQRAAEILAAAEKPVAIVGGSLWSTHAAQSIERVSEIHSLPVVASFRRQHYMDNRHPNYVGDLTFGVNPELTVLLRESDCLLALGCRLSDAATQGFTIPAEPSALRSLIHVHPDPGELGRLWPTRFQLATVPEPLLDRLIELAPPDGRKRRDWLERLRRCYAEWRQPTPLPGPVQLSEILLWLSDNLPADAIITNGAGNYAGFLHRYFRFKTYMTQIAPTSGSMGYGLPAAIAAKLAHRQRTVICLAGDGCMQMTLNELSTALQQNAKIIVIVANNGIYGTIRMHQEKHFPGRVSGTEMHNPDFAALARAYGGHGETVNATADFPDAFNRALQSDRMAVIDIRIDPRAISTTGALRPFPE
ncbi:MAG: thiamine pyrophosphate-binding protein [Rhodobacteraceae bacterium]|nr:thiamine pyrophosphate-binding protein [Paracoccaceae bacterium]